MEIEVEVRSTNIQKATLPLYATRGEGCWICIREGGENHIIITEITFISENAIDIMTYEHPAKKSLPTLENGFKVVSKEEFENMVASISDKIGEMIGMCN
jgi:hypothetical protein